MNWIETTAVIRSWALGCVTLGYATVFCLFCWSRLVLTYWWFTGYVGLLIIKSILWTASDRSLYMTTEPLILIARILAVLECFWIAGCDDPKARLRSLLTASAVSVVMLIVATGLPPEVSAIRSFSRLRLQAGLATATLAVVSGFLLGVRPKGAYGLHATALTLHACSYCISLFDGRYLNAPTKDLYWRGFHTNGFAFLLVTVLCQLLWMRAAFLVRRGR